MQWLLPMSPQEPSRICVLIMWWSAKAQGQDGAAIRNGKCWMCISSEELCFHATVVGWRERAKKKEGLEAAYVQILAFYSQIDLSWTRSKKSSCFVNYPSFRQAVFVRRIMYSWEGTIYTVYAHRNGAGCCFFSWPSSREPRTEDCMSFTLILSLLDLLCCWLGFTACST